jgi:hypothetical protein
MENKTLSILVAIVLPRIDSLMSLQLFLARIDALRISLLLAGGLLWFPCLGSVWMRENAEIGREQIC